MAHQLPKLVALSSPLACQCHTHSKKTLFQNINIFRGPLLAHQLPKSVALALPLACQCHTHGKKAIGPTVAAEIGPTDIPMLGQRLHSLWVVG